MQPVVNTTVQRPSFSSVHVLQQLLRDHQQKTKNSSTNPSANSSTPTTSSLDLNAILRALLAKQNQQKSTIDKQVETNSTSTQSTSSSLPVQSVPNSQIQLATSSTTSS